MEEKAILQACNNSCVCAAQLKFLFPFHVYGGLKDPAGLSVSHRDVPAFNSHSCDLDMSSGDVSDPVASGFPLLSPEPFRIPIYGNAS